MAEYRYQQKISARESISDSMDSNDFDPDNLGLIHEALSDFDLRMIDKYEKLKASKDASSKEILSALTQIPYQVRFDLVERYSDNERQRRYIDRRRKERYVELSAQEDVPDSNIKAGIERDALFAEMIGTPALAVYKIATAIAESNDKARTHLPPLTGYHSGIEAGSIGNYHYYIDVYDRAEALVRRGEGSDKMSDDAIEHKAVLMAARWVSDALKFNPEGRGPNSPYAVPQYVALALARLGEGVQKRFMGMRAGKTRNGDVKFKDVRQWSHLDRFIGRSGDNSYRTQYTGLKRKLGHAEEALATHENDHNEDKIFEFLKAEEQYQLDRLEREHEAQYTEIANRYEALKGQLPYYIDDPDKLAQEVAAADKAMSEELMNAAQEYELAVGWAKVDAENLTPHEYVKQLRDDFKQVERKYYMKQSAADKALDLHFAINKKDDLKIDFISTVPLSVIDKMHRMVFVEGIDHEKAFYVAMTGLIHGHVDRDTVEKVKESFFDNGLDAVFGNGSNWHKEYNAVNDAISYGLIAQKLRKQFPDYAFNDTEIKFIASEVDPSQLKRVANVFDAPTVQRFVSKGIPLFTAPDILQGANNADYAPTDEQYIKWSWMARNCRQPTQTLERAIRTFGVGSVDFIASTKAPLNLMIQLSNIFDKHGIDLSLAQISELAKVVEGNYSIDATFETDLRTGFSAFSFQDLMEVVKGRAKIAFAAELKTKMVLSDLRKIIFMAHDFATLEQVSAFLRYELPPVNSFIGSKNAWSRIRSHGVYEIQNAPPILDAIQRLLGDESLSEDEAYYFFDKLHSIPHDLENKDVIYKGFNKEHLHRMVDEGISFSDYYKVYGDIKTHRLYSKEIDADFVLDVASLKAEYGYERVDDRTPGYIKTIQSLFDVGFTLQDLGEHPVILSPLLIQELQT